MAVDPPMVPPPAPPSGQRIDSGEHPAADKSVVRIGRFSWSFRLSGVAKYFVVPILAALGPLILSLRAPSKGDVEAESKKVKQEVAAPVNANADLQAKQQAELARLAAIIQTLEKARQETVAPAKPAPGQPRARRRIPDPGTAKKVETATKALEAIQVRAAAAPKPQMLPVELPKDQQQGQPQAAKPAEQRGSAGGANP